MNETVLGAIFLSIAASIWGGMYVVVKVVVDVVPPLELVWLRYVIAVAVLAVIGTYMRESWRISREHVLLLIAIGVIGNTISIVTQEIGTMLSTAQMGAIITSTTPAFIVLFAYIVLREQITLRKLMSVALATIGVIIIIWDTSLSQSTQLGGIWLVVAALTWALMSVLLKKVPDQHSPLVVTTYSSLVAVVCLTPFVVPALGDLPLEELLTPTITGGLLYLGVISTALGFLLWNKGLQLMQASSGGLFFFFQPIVGACLGWLLLGETLHATFWLGTCCIFIAVFIVIRTETSVKKARDEQS